mgnify:CR=1 FL=1
MSVVLGIDTGGTFTDFVLVDHDTGAIATAKVPSSIGEFSWGGAASTGFWVDPVEDITAVFLTQLLPSSTHNLRAQFKQLVKQALID